MEPETNILYDREFLIDRAYSGLNKITGDSHNEQLLTPKVGICNGSTYIQNFRNICDKLNRKEADVKSFIDDETQAKSSVSEKGELFISVVNKKMNLEEWVDRIIKKYVDQYVKCSQCKSISTVIEKENRITYMTCNKCLSKKALHN